MDYTREKEQIQKQKEDWQKEKEILTLKKELKQDKKNFKGKDNKKLTTTKLLMFFLFVNCTIIEVFTLGITVFQLKTGYGADLTPLQMLITSVVGQVIAFAIYSLKSLKENTKGGIIYDTTMFNYQNQSQESDDQEGIAG